ncbi:MAG: hypothetical protein QW507_02170 [Candidatus Nanoarchaeia archaeon]|nr:hypothetical protein [Candidatus Haiyanarchaeum thermophilum]MCW1302782.1 hypothetical protein [Candidatus Haiyanarchaeum thermophilum]MCW1304120.1 hypothetical protein [Candidatus Haiyanarchaeum thermophilum]MCW1306643.1 hypothetical protein [Candidatus Haiyanarchaeum thermophilum]MCW1307401.1 hypothetical protein [Candidatus Haiyanarchaeum thermophilum]
MTKTKKLNGSIFRSLIIGLSLVKIGISIAATSASRIPSMEDIWLVIAAAAADSINPCIMSVLILLISQLSVMKASRRIRKVGIAYISMIFLSYLTLGLLLTLGIKVVFTGSQLIATYLKLIVAALILAIGLINLKDFFLYGKFISLGIPKRFQKKISFLAAKGGIIATLLLALLVTLIEFPCSGAMYAGLILHLVSEGVETLFIFPLLLLYNLIFVLPLILIVVLYWKGVGSERLEEFRRKYRRIFRLVLGLVLIALALILLK